MTDLTQPAVYTWFHTNWAVRSGDQTFIGWHEADGIHIGAYDEVTRAWETFHLMQTSPDDHNVVSIGIRGDGRLLVAYCIHDDDFMRVRISTNALDVTAWGAEQILDTGTAVTYPNLLYLSDEDRWYLFHRDRGVGLNLGTVQYVSSDDDGVSWSGVTVVVSPVGNERPYAKYGTNGVDRIDIAVTDGHPREVTANSVYHLWYDANVAGWKASDGTSLGSPPFSPPDATLVYDGSTIKAWDWDMATGGGNPVILFVRFPNDEDPALDHRYMYARWDGAAWDVNEIVVGGGRIVTSGIEDHYSGGLNVDHADPSIVYLSRQTGEGVWEIERWDTSDGGTSWTSAPVTGGGKNLRPFVVRGDSRVIWFAGDYDTFRDFSTLLLADPPLLEPEPPPIFVPPDVTGLLTGSHRATFEARVLTTFQTGVDPDGVEIPILDGDVTYDATAEVFATLDLTTDGMDERRRSLFPRRASDLLAPYGNEVFVRRGIDIGSGVVWVPLGYFRLDDDEQPLASDQPIRLSGQDRMAAIVDAELVVPRQFGASVTNGSVVASLVTGIYPGATIVWDDESETEPLGRQIIVERDRYAALLDIVESVGKVMYWDNEGILRIEDSPDPDDLVWEIKAGHLGVLVEANRRVGRDGMNNAIVAIGEGGDTGIPVQAVVVDAGPNSPTSWFPPEDPDELWFGQHPDFYSSPLITTETQAVKAATELLRRRIGAPYSVDWGSVVNPSLRPRQAVRVTHKDGNREKHIVETLTIPLKADRAMRGTTREQTLVSLAEVTPSQLVG